MRWTKLFLAAVFFCFGLLFPFSTVFAQERFSTSYTINYQFTEEEQAKVNAEIRIRNLTSRYYVSEYSLVLGSDSIVDIKARDQLGNLQTTVAKTELDNGQQGTKIHVVFNQQSAGKDQELVWYLSYRDSSIIEKKGTVWQINLPKLALDQQIGRYNINLQIPTAYGDLLYISPEPNSSDQYEEYSVYSFSKEQFASKGVRAGFGPGQVYYFDLLYHLKNPSFSSAVTEIALPPDLPNFQKIVFDSIKPAPDSINIDSDGNYLAQYRISGNSTTTVRAKGWALITNRSGVEASLSKELYLHEDKYWPVKDPQIQSLAGKIKSATSGESANELAQAVYDYVVSELSYSKTRNAGGLERKGALQALEEKNNAVCMEFTDLFVTLARAAGLPARTVEGYAYAEDTSRRPGSEEDVLHAWAQVFLPRRGWVNVDPTWGSTTGQDYLNSFDTNHLAFVVKGKDSEYPYPAGVYKTDPDQFGDVSVRFGSEKDLEYLNKNVPEPVLGFKSFPLSLGSHSFNSWITLKNNTGWTFYNSELHISGDFKPVDSEGNFVFGTLPPYTSYSKKVKFASGSWLPKTGTVNLALNYNLFNSDNVMEVKKMEEISTASPLLWGGGIGFFGLVIAIIFIKLKS